MIVIRCAQGQFLAQYDSGVNFKHLLDCPLICKKWANTGLFLVFFKQTSQFVQQINVKYVHPVYGAGIRT